MAVALTGRRHFREKKMTPDKIGNGNTWRTLSTIGFILSLGFIFVDKMVMPNVNSGELAKTVQAQGTDIAILKDILPSLRPLPTSVDGLKIMVDSIKRQLDRFEITLDDHVRKGK